jgi:hypothetical protein
MSHEHLARLAMHREPARHINLGAHQVKRVRRVWVYGEYITRAPQDPGVRRRPRVAMDSDPEKQNRTRRCRSQHQMRRMHP